MRTQEQIDNLETLINGLKSLPAGYCYLAMKVFAEDDLEAAKGEIGNTCGNCGCIVGHAPSFGIDMDAQYINMDEDDDCYINWRRYSVDAFGLQCLDANGGFDVTSDWSFCFSGDWLNSVREAIARLELAQAGNIPDTWRYSDRFVK